jgi:hypothetical protein
VKEAYKHDYSGSCAPGQSQAVMNIMFSVGIFQWLPKSSGKGLKKSAVKFRIKGNSSSPKAIYKTAEHWCKMMDKGVMPSTKSMTI